MSKLQASVEGQTIQFQALSKIFGSLGTDLPSGKIRLGNGDFAYWRLYRNLSELKRKKKNMRDTVACLTEALKSIVRSKDFQNHYGIKGVPELPEDHELHSLFRNLLSQNTSRVTYTSTYFGGNRPRIEAVQVALGNLVFFNAHKGMENPPEARGITGRMWMDKKKPEEFYIFSIVSPVVKLTDRISPERLSQEISTKIKQNLPDMARALKLEFTPGQFDDYLDNGLDQLAQKHNSQQTNKEKKQNKNEKKTTRGQTPHLQHVDELALHPEASAEDPTKVEVTTITLDENDLGVELEEARGLGIDDFREQYKAEGREDGVYALVYDLKFNVIKKLTVVSGVWEESIPDGQQALIDEAATEVAEDTAAVQEKAD